MPYITQDSRTRIEDTGFIDTPGELNYVLTLACAAYLKQHGKSYSTINDILGALEGAKLEFYRRVAVPYEDEKIEQNGDVY